MTAATHQFISTGWCNEHQTVEFAGSLAECNAYLAEHGHQADYVRRAPKPTKAELAQAARSVARAAMLASFGRAV